MPTIVSYEEWKKLPDAATSGPTAEHPEFWDFGKGDDGKAVARLKEDRTAEYLASIDKKVALAAAATGVPAS